MSREMEPDLSERVALLVAEIEGGKAWGSVLLPLPGGDTCGATLNEAEEALCVVVDRLRARSEDRDRLVSALQGCRSDDQDDMARLRAEVETLKEEQVAFVRALEQAQTENERLRLAPSRAVLRSVIDEMRSLGQEWREEFPDGRVCKAEMNRIADRIAAELARASDETEAPDV